MKKLLLMLMCFGLSTLLFSHCGSCGTENHKNDWQEKKLEKKVSILEAFSLSTEDEKKLLGIEENYLLEKQELKEQYEADVSTILTEEQTELYLQSGGKKGCCSRKK